MTAGMGGVTLHELAAAASNAGGIGTLGAIPFTQKPEELRAEIKRTKVQRACDGWHLYACSRTPLGQTVGFTRDFPSKVEAPGVSLTPLPPPPLPAPPAARRPC
jgi:hypothetical protein